MHVVKVWSATKNKDRQLLDERITKWLREHPELAVVDKQVRLSSDREFHCLTVVLFLRNTRRRTTHKGETV